MEFLTLGGIGTGVPLRATISSFGPTLLSKVLDLNDTQESSLGLVFHYADRAGLPLLDVTDLRAVITHLVSAEGKAELVELGGLSKATAGVILRKLVALSDQGADAFFGEPELDTRDLLRLTPDGRGIVSLIELPALQDRPTVFSTFLMWLLADLFHELPEVGDADKPSLVFFFDEAHLLFADASKAFLEAVTRTVRLIRSKGVGVFFVTQSPTDVPDAVLAQLGTRVQHQLRAHTPNDAKALRATVATYPHSGYDDLGEVLTGLGIGEAVVTVMNERGAPTPVAWTKLRAPQSRMGPADAAVMTSPVEASRGLLGLPYRWGGTDSTVGMDCSGLVFRVMGLLGVAVPRDADDQFERAPFRSREDWEVAGRDDLIFFGEDSITHVGFYLGDGTYLSEHGSSGTVVRGVEEDPYWGFARYA